MIRGALRAVRGLSSGAGAADGDAIFDGAVSRAARFVFLRMLPLAGEAELAGGAEAIGGAIEAGARRLCGAHAWRAAGDARAAAHLHLGALALAAYRVLRARLRDDRRALSLVFRGFGAAPGAANAASLPAYYMAKAALLLGPDKMAVVERMTANCAKDFGPSFDLERETSKDRRLHRMVVKKCFYHRFFADEDAPELTQVFCALDEAIFSPLKAESSPVSFELEKVLSKGDKSCDFTFRKR